MMRRNAVFERRAAALAWHTKARRAKGQQRGPDAREDPQQKRCQEARASLMRGLEDLMKVSFIVHQGEAHGALMRGANVCRSRRSCISTSPPSGLTRRSPPHVPTSPQLPRCLVEAFARKARGKKGE